MRSARSFFGAQSAAYFVVAIVNAVDVYMSEYILRCRVIAPGAPKRNAQFEHPQYSVANMTIKAAFGCWSGSTRQRSGLDPDRSVAATSSGEALSPAAGIQRTRSDRGLISSASHRQRCSEVTGARLHQFTVQQVDKAVHAMSRERAVEIKQGWTDQERAAIRAFCELAHDRDERRAVTVRGRQINCEARGLDGFNGGGAGKHGTGTSLVHGMPRDFGARR